MIIFIVKTHTFASSQNFVKILVIFYESEALTLRLYDEGSITASEMKFIRRTARVTEWNRTKTKDLLKSVKLSQPICHLPEK